MFFIYLTFFVTSTVLLTINNRKKLLFNLFLQFLFPVLCNITNNFSGYIDYRTVKKGRYTIVEIHKGSTHKRSYFFGKLCPAMNSVVDPNTLNLYPDPPFLLNSDPDPGLC